MSDNKFRGPTCMYGPNGEAEVFNHSADVPEGWADSPEAAARAPEPTLDMDRKEIVAALNAGNIAFVKNAKTEALYAQLTEAVKAHLTESGIEFAPALPTKQLLELTRAPE